MPNAVDRGRTEPAGRLTRRATKALLAALHPAGGDSFVTMAYAMLVGIGAFVTVAVTGRAIDLSTLIGLLMRSIVVTNAIVLLALVQHTIEVGADVRMVLIQGGRTLVRLILMTAAATILAMIPLALSSIGARRWATGVSASLCTWPRARLP